MRKRIVLVAVAVLALAACVVILCVGRKSPVERQANPSPRTSRAGDALDRGGSAGARASRRAGLKASEEKKARAQKKKSRGSLERHSGKPVRSSADDSDEDSLPPEARKLSNRIEEALDKEDLKKAVACAKEALNCPYAEVRQSMVETLGWFGAKGLPELTPFLADADDDVRESAMNEWSIALSDIDDEAEKIGVVEMAMLVLNDDDALDDLSNEYIGVDEKIAVDSLVKIIEAGGSEKGVAKAKETYEFVTGEEFTNRADAEKWIAEEYVPSSGNASGGASGGPME